LHGIRLQVTRTVPIVFTQVTDPVGAGFVESLGRPGGNATGFLNFYEAYRKRIDERGEGAAQSQPKKSDAAQ